MRFSIRATLVSACVLAFASAACGAAGDIVAPRSGDVTLAGSWYGYETAGGDRFRWVDRGAKIVVHHPGKRLVTVVFRLEAGPSLGTTQFPFLVLDAAGRQVAGILVSGRETVPLVLPADPNADNTYELATVGGGKHLSTDKRILNFRVFEIDDGSSAAVAAAGSSGPDVFDPHNGVRLGSRGWYTLEHYKGETFRWISNDADFTVDWPHDQETDIRAIVEPGPGMGGHPAAIQLRDANGRVVATRTADRREPVLFPVRLHAGSNRFSFHVDGGGKPAPGDKRTLNFRVFALSALQ